MSQRKILTWSLFSLTWQFCLKCSAVLSTCAVSLTMCFRFGRVSDEVATFFNNFVLHTFRSVPWSEEYWLFAMNTAGPSDPEINRHYCRSFYFTEFVLKLSKLLVVSSVSTGLGASVLTVDKKWSRILISKRLIKMLRRMPVGWEFLRHNRTVKMCNHYEMLYQPCQLLIFEI